MYLGAPAGFYAERYLFFQDSIAMGSLRQTSCCWFGRCSPSQAAVDVNIAAVRATDGAGTQCTPQRVLLLQLRFGARSCAWTAPHVVLVARPGCLARHGQSSGSNNRMLTTQTPHVHDLNLNKPLIPKALNPAGAERVRAGQFGIQHRAEPVAGPGGRVAVLGRALRQHVHPDRQRHLAAVRRHLLPPGASCPDAIIMHHIHMRRFVGSLDRRRVRLDSMREPELAAAQQLYHHALLCCHLFPATA